MQLSWEADGASVIAVAPTESDRRRVREILASNGISVREAASLEQALAEVPASVVLYDSEGEEPWSEALVHLMGRWPNARFVLVSRLADEQLWIQALEAGAYDLLAKPFEPIELQCVVRGALEGVYAHTAA